MPETTEINNYKRKFLSGIILASAAATLLYIPFALSQGYVLNAVIQIAAFAVFLFIDYLVRKKKKDTLLPALILFTFAFFLNSSGTFTTDHDTLLWFLIFPPAVLFSLSLRWGLIWIFASFVLMIPLFLYHVFHTGLPPIRAFNILFGYAFSSVVAFFIEKSRSSIEEKLNTIGITDFLTSAKNRRGFDLDLELKMQTAERYGRQLCLLLLDLDHFKKINDMYGHSAGDRVLIEFVETIKSNLRPGDGIYRIGGEEFAVLLEEAGLEGGLSFAKRLRTAVNNHEFNKAGRLTVSMGVVCHAKDCGKDEILKRADRLLYRAKEKGRDRIEADRN